MVKMNENLLKLNDVYTFLNLFKVINNYKEKNPNIELLNLGVGDVSKPIINPVIDEMIEASKELGNIETFKGYGYYYGHDFLKKKIKEERKNISIDEIYISNGAKSDTTNILELFSKDSLVCLFNPTYPVYKDALDIMGMKYEYIDATIENNFMPIPNKKYDLVYICSPNNPLGISYLKEYLKKWVDYAIENECIILYDNVYNAFITSDAPKSIYEIEGSKKVAIEFNSYSKKASFTGVRCSYYIIPNELMIKDANKYWKKRTMVKFNGVDYIAQRGALATYTDESKIIIDKNIKDYLNNAKYMKKVFEECGYKVFGGIDSPYLWITKDNLDSYEFFIHMLEKLNIIIIPGIIFGSNGRKFFRVSALADKKVIIKAMERIKNEK